MCVKDGVVEVHPGADRLVGQKSALQGGPDRLRAQIFRHLAGRDRALAQIFRAEAGRDRLLAQKTAPKAGRHWPFLRKVLSPPRTKPLRSKSTGGRRPL